MKTTSITLTIVFLLLCQMNSLAYTTGGPVGPTNFPCICKNAIGRPLPLVQGNYKVLSMGETREGNFAPIINTLKKQENKLTVSYTGYTKDNILYVKNLKTNRVQSRTLLNKKAVFNLSQDGGEYGIYQDINPPKSDALSPQLKLLKKVKLSKNQNKTVQIN